MELERLYRDGVEVSIHPKYADMVKDAQPLAYWRMDEGDSVDFANDQIEAHPPIKMPSASVPFNGSSAYVIAYDWNPMMIDSGILEHEITHGFMSVETRIKAICCGVVQTSVFNHPTYEMHCCKCGKPIRF